MSLQVKPLSPISLQGDPLLPQTGAHKAALAMLAATQSSEIISTAEQELTRDQNKTRRRSRLEGGTNRLLSSMVVCLQDIVFLYRLLRHPKTPWYARGLLCLPVMYLCSPIQLMPNFIPVLGQMDDVCVIWMAKKFAQKLVDVNTRQECRDAAVAIGLHPLVKRLAENHKSKGGHNERL